MHWSVPSIAPRLASFSLAEFRRCINALQRYISPEARSIRLSLVFPDFSHKARAKSPGSAPVLRQPSVMLKLKNKQALGWLGD